MDPSQDMSRSSGGGLAPGKYQICIVYPKGEWVILKEGGISNGSLKPMEATFWVRIQGKESWPMNFMYNRPVIGCDIVETPYQPNAIKYLNFRINPANSDSLRKNQYGS